MAKRPELKSRLAGTSLQRGATRRLASPTRRGIEIRNEATRLFVTRLLNIAASNLGIGIGYVVSPETFATLAASATAYAESLDSLSIERARLLGMFEERRCRLDEWQRELHKPFDLLSYRIRREGEILGVESDGIEEALRLLYYAEARLGDALYGTDDARSARYTRALNILRGGNATSAAGVDVIQVLEEVEQAVDHVSKVAEGWRPQRVPPPEGRSPRLSGGLPELDVFIPMWLQDHVNVPPKEIGRILAMLSQHQGTPADDAEVERVRSTLLTWALDDVSPFHKESARLQRILSARYGSCFAEVEKSLVVRTFRRHYELRKRRITNRFDVKDDDERESYLIRVHGGSVAGLATELVWQAFKLAEATDRLDDRRSFSFPIEGKRTRSALLSRFKTGETQRSRKG